MSSAAIETSAFAIDLDERQTHRVLERALRAGADLSLWPGTRFDAPPLIGPFMAATESGLLVLVGPAEPGTRMPLASEYCEAAFMEDHTRYMFTTDILEIDDEAGSWRIQVARPDRLQVVQRRRYQRRDLRGTTAVQIRAANAGGAPAVIGTLFNMDPGGLACRVERPAADRHAIDAPVGLRFSLPGAGAPFQISGHVRSKTGGADPRQVIMTIEFEAEAGLELERLAESLYGAVPAMTQG